MDSPKRSLIKALGWRCVATSVTIVTTYGVTGDVNAALSIGGIGLVAKFVLYYVWERLWSKITWGLQTKR